MSFKFAALAAAGLSLAPTIAAAQAAPTWIEAPSAADVAAAYPAKAKEAGVGGTVELTCTINREGRPRTCAVLKETPSNYLFGTAARRLAERLRVNELNLRGQDVMIPVTFNPEVLKAEGVAITKPAWAAMPSIEDFQATFPKTANGVNSVRVVLACTVLNSGALGACSVDSEDPPGQGYGQGALALAAKFRVGPWSQDGQPTLGARLKLPIRYELTQVAATPKP
jgi:TonB family protein